MRHIHPKPASLNMDIEHNQLRSNMRKHVHMNLFTLVLLLSLPMLGTCAAAAPSFDCEKASTHAEKAICASQTLSRIDSAIAKAYKQAQQYLADDAQAMAELKTSQRLFLLIRNAEATPHPGNDYDIQAHMNARLDVLRGIKVKPRSGFEGEWKTTEGSLWVGVPGKNGLRPVNATSRTHDSKHWTCEFLGEARQEGDELVVQGRDKYMADYASWQLKLTRRGRMLELSYLRPANITSQATYNTFCGMNGSLVGDYFPSDPLEDTPCTGVAPGECRE